MSIRFTFNYTCGIPYAQNAASLSVWTNFSQRRRLAELPILFRDAARVVTKPMVLDLPLEVNETSPQTARLPADAALKFEVLAAVTNDEGRRARDRSGNASVLLSDLLQKGTRRFALEYFNDWNEKGERFKCGELEFTKIEFSDILPKDIHFDAPTPFSFVPENAELLSKTTTCAVARRIVPYTEEAASEGTGLTPIREILRRAQNPWYNTSAGATAGSYYWYLARRSSNNPAYFGALLKSVLFRHNRDIDWFRNTINDQFERIKTDPNYFNIDFNECVRIIGDLLCAPSTATPYIPDTVDENTRLLGAKALPKGLPKALPKHDPKLVKPGESWDDAGVRNSGDCEDLAHLIHRMFHGLLEGKWEPNSALAAAARLLSLYVGCGTLTTVLSPSLGNEQKPASNEPKIIGSKEDLEAEEGAHMCYHMIPRPRFVEYLSRTTTGLPANLAGQHTEPGWRNLITCILEGTGRLDVDQRPVAAMSMSRDRAQRLALVENEKLRRASIMALLSGAPVTAHMQMTRSQRRTTRLPNARIGEFYMQPTSANTLAFLDDLNAIEFMWATRGERIPEPANADPLFLDDPALLLQQKQRMVSTLDEHRDDGTEQVTLDSDSDSDSDEEDFGSWKSVASSLSSLKQPPVESSLKAAAAAPSPSIDWNFSANNRLAIAAKPLEDRSAGVLPIRFGIDTEDLLRQDAPAHVALLPTTSFDQIEARVGAETLRQLRPWVLPGDFAPLEAIFAAEDASLRALGIDPRAGEAEGKAAYERLRKWTEVEMDAMVWPSHAQAKSAGYSLVTFFMPREDLALKKSGAKTTVVDDVMREYGALKKSGLVKHMRVGLEEPMPRREHVVLQFMCDSKRAMVFAQQQQQQS